VSSSYHSCFQCVGQSRQCRSVAQAQRRHYTIHSDNGGKLNQAVPKRKITNNRTQGWGYPVTLLNNFQLTLFHKYAELLKRRFSEDFQEVRLSGHRHLDISNMLFRLCQRMITCPWPLTRSRNTRKSSTLAGSLLTSLWRSSCMYPDRSLHLCPV
jgi:hypothetical protein